MGFATPLALLALVAIAVPVLAHLMRQKDLPVIELPTLRLLMAARAESRRRFRVRDRWLLALRVLAVAAVTLAAAAPFVWRDSAFADGKVSSLVLVVDDSMSMHREDGGGSLFERAIARAEASLDGLSDESEVALIWAGRPARVAVPRGGTPAAVRRALRNARPAARGTDLAGAAQLTRRALSSARHARRVLVLSDFAAHAAADAVDWPDAELAFEQLGDGGPNVAVTEAVAAPNPATERTSLRIEVQSEAPVDLRIEGPGGERLASVRATPEEGRATVNVELDAGDADALTVHALADDVLPMDDRRAVLLEAPAAARVLLVDGDAAGAVGRGEVSYLSRALEVQPEARQREGRVRIRVVDAATLDGQSLSDIDVVFLANLATLTPAQAEALREHHAGGGGIVIAAGERLRPRSWRARLGSLLPASLGGASDGARTLQPLASSVRGLDHVSARRALALDADPNARVEARWSDGTPALVIGERVAVWGSTFDEDWTDLPFHPGFVPLAHRLARELGGRAVAPAVTGAGEPVALPAGTRVRDPSGEIWAIGDQPFARTGTPGIYRVLDEDDAVATRFVIAAPAEESQLSAGPPPADAVSEAAAEATHRAPIGRWVFLVFGLLVLAEGLLRGARRGLAQ